MGLVTAPLSAFLFLAREIADRVERALYGEEELRAALQTLHCEWENGEVDEIEFAKRETDLARRLLIAQRRNRP